MIGIGQMNAAIYTDIVSYAAVFIYNSVLNIAAVANANFRDIFKGIVFNFYKCFVIIVTHNITAYNGRAVPNTASHAYHTVFYTAGINNRTFGYDCFFKRSTADLCRRQHACMAVNNLLVIE